jgi:hypothetical protein
MTNNNRSVTTTRVLDRLDHVGSLLSSLCAVHCLCMPLLLGALPALGLAVQSNRTFERSTSAALVLFATGCVWSGCRVHRQWGLFALLAPGAGLIAWVQSAAPDCCAAAAFSWPNAMLMTFGGGLIAGSHRLNRHLRARCECRTCQGSVSPA